MSGNSSHKSTPKSRRRQKGETPTPRASPAPPSSKSKTSKSHSAGGDSTSQYPLVGLTSPARTKASPWVVVPVILMTVGLFRWATSLWDYSGYMSPPMHGDFEAQRHWMEITIHLPFSIWYFFDLEWWGLDYPPLTAYHSWFLGRIGNAINSDWFALNSSRGLDLQNLKTYMRATVLFSEYIVYIPSVVVLLRRFSRSQGVSTGDLWIALTAVLMQPATILIDHGHFQYNTVMLGLFAASLSSMYVDSFTRSAVFFVLALGFKQMALFYAPACFAYLLGVCFVPTINVTRFLSIAVATVLSFALLFAPLLIGVFFEWEDGVDVSKFLRSPLLNSIPFELDQKSWYFSLVVTVCQVVHRVFPFARGLFEDKVANFWCAIHTFHKLTNYTADIVQRGALLATSIAILPPCIVIFLKPRKDLLLPAFATTAWAFFLFSFQVHEKNVLLPLLPMTLLLGGQGGLSASSRSWIGLANITGAWTLFPLLSRDGLRIPYFVLTLLWAYLLGLPPVSLSSYSSFQKGSATASAVELVTALLHTGTYAVMVMWHVVEAFVSPPANKPDLWVVVNVLVGAAVFGLSYLWCLWQLLSKSQLLGASGVSKKGKRKTA